MKEDYKEDLGKIRRSVDYFWRQLNIKTFGRLLKVLYNIYS